MKSSKTNTLFNNKKINEIKGVNLSERFGINLSQLEVIFFLKKIEVSNIEINLKFITEFIGNILNKIPFQNYKMIERGFGHIPTEKDIKEDMFSLNGGTCATINTFIGAILYKIGFNVSLINGTMMRTNDHIAILLNLENKFYTIDLGDGQPYFTPNLINKNTITKHPFRTYRTITQSNNLRVEFLINAKWSTDVILHLVPKTFNEVYTTLEKHYTQKKYGPFWNGVRFAIYPNNKIIAIRDKTFIIQKSNSIKKIKINNHKHLKELTTKYLPNFIDQIDLCFKTLRIL